MTRRVYFVFFNRFLKLSMYCVEYEGSWYWYIVKGISNAFNSGKLFIRYSNASNGSKVFVVPLGPNFTVFTEASLPIL